ncbi:MAG: hypothetical protein ACR2JC_08160 [Chloroflexota bacterium]
MQRIRGMQGEIARLPPREAMSYAYLISRDMPDEAARMLVAEMLLDYRRRSISPVSQTTLNKP